MKEAYIEILKLCLVSFFLNSLKLETTKMSTDRRKDKTIGLFHIMEYYTAIKEMNSGCKLQI